MKSLLVLFFLASVLGGCARKENSATALHTADVMVEPGAVKELCFTAKKDSEVIFRFEADQPLSFNFHYHLDDKMYYPVAEHATQAEKGQYLVPKDDTYCLNWINAAETAASLSAQVEGGSNYVWY